MTITALAKRAKQLVSDLLYERRYGVETDGHTILAMHDEEHICYIAMNWRQLRWALPASSVSPHDVFLDIGSGKGRAVLVAAMDYPFRRVIGVEFVREFHETAQRNLAAVAKRLKASQVDLVCADARNYPIPDDVTVIFMNNPIRGSIFTAVVNAIAESMRRHTRPLRLIYHNPVEEDALLATGHWRRTQQIISRRQRHQWPFGATCVYEWAQPSNHLHAIGRRVGEGP